MSSETLVAGVDSSTQSCKIVVCNAETGALVRTARAPHPDGTEVDPHAWWRAWRQASGDGILDGVQAIAVGGQQHGMVTLDADGEVVRPALLWNDTRSAGAAADLVSEFGGPQAWAEQIGLVPVAAITATKLRWLARTEPDNLERSRTCVLPHDWLTGRILQDGNGFERWTTDRGDASGTGYWSAHSQDYRPDVMELAIGRTIEVPEVLAPNAVAGRTDSGMLVGPGTGDNMGAALGLGLAPGDVVVSLGTSGTVFARHADPLADASGALQSFADAEGGYLPLLCTLNAARVMNAGATILGVDYAEFDRLALAAAPGAGGLTLLPYLDGERTPNLPGASGTLLGLTRANATPENLARAHVEGMLLNLVAGVAALREHGVPVERILLVGGAAASVAVHDIAPLLFGVPVAVPAAGEYVGIGAARQAAWTLSGGAGPPVWEISIDVVAEPGAPDAGAEIVARYRDAVRTVHGIG
ncbi:MAG: FGGY family carbohydrate kinase [Tetrasphaera sp.]